MTEALHHSSTKEKILAHVTRLCALHGGSGLSMRELAKEIPLNQSVIYHYFSDKDALLKEMYLTANTKLGEARAELNEVEGVEAKFRQLIQFQLEHAELIVAVLKYYLYKREDFYLTEFRTLPPKAILHVQEVLEYGNEKGELDLVNVEADAKVITHLINGYLLEYYPHMPEKNESDQLIESMVGFIMRAVSTTPTVTCE